MVVTAGDLGPDLAKKLGITEHSTVALVGVPPEVVVGVPPGTEVRRRAQGRADVVVAFFTERRHFERRLLRLESMIYPDGGLWIAWPKRSSTLATDLSGDVVREVALPRGLVDNKVCAIDRTWSGLRLVWRRERRHEVKK
jgi:hypothetical protein